MQFIKKVQTKLRHAELVADVLKRKLYDKGDDKKYLDDFIIKATVGGPVDAALVKSGSESRAGIGASRAGWARAGACRCGPRAETRKVGEGARPGSPPRANLDPHQTPALLPGLSASGRAFARSCRRR